MPSPLQLPQRRPGGEPAAYFGLDKEVAEKGLKGLDAAKHCLAALETEVICKIGVEEGRKLTVEEKDVC
eukprot:COSAG02_NODE_1140_length_14275_cov_154.904557_4_plen_69_part_00